MSVFQQLGCVETIINATGTVTRLGGAPMSQAVLDAYVAAAGDAVSLEQLHAAASKRISVHTATDSALVTSGAAAGLTLGAAAILARHDLSRMEQLPHCVDFPCEFLVARDQRSGYDHAVRAAGAKLVDVGFNEVVSGAGVRRAETWEFAAAINDQTAGVLYVQTSTSRPQLCDLVQVAHSANIPVLVDAAAELPPRRNLTKIAESGADLVVFSGGKAIGGPQSTGILCGRHDLISSAAIQMLDMDDHWELWDPPREFIDKEQLVGMPRHGIGRALKVQKEEIVALVAALEAFVSKSFSEELHAMRKRLDVIASALQHLNVDCKLLERDAAELPPLLVITLPTSGNSALDVCRQLRAGSPPIYVGHGLLSENKIVVHPWCMRDEHATVVGDRLRELLAS